MTEDQIHSLDPQGNYTLLLADGGSIVGTLTYPTRDGIGTSMGGYPVVHPRRVPSLKHSTLHFYTIDTGREVFEVLIPLDRIAAICKYTSLVEQIVESSESSLWTDFGVNGTWDYPIADVVLFQSIDVVKAKGLGYRTVLSVPNVVYFPHPLKFPRFHRFTPASNQVLYIDPVELSNWMPPPMTESAVLDMLSVQDDMDANPSAGGKRHRLHVFSGAIAFFDPIQKVNWRGRTAELVALTADLCPPGCLPDTWMLGCMREECLMLFRDSVERIAKPYVICGEWRNIGEYETEYGIRTQALFLVAAAFLGPGTERPNRATIGSHFSAWRRIETHGLPEAPTDEEDQLVSITLLCDDERGQIYIDALPIYCSIPIRRFLISFVRLQNRTRRALAREEVERLLGVDLSGTVGSMKRKMAKSLADLIRYDTDLRGWRLAHPVKLPSVFLSYCRVNGAAAERLRESLVANGFDVWWDQEILPGEDWRSAIRSALLGADFFVVCLSKELSSRDKSGVFPEIMAAIEELRMRPPGSIYLLSVKFTETEIPPLRIYGDVTLGDLQCVKLYPDGQAFEQGVRLLVRAMIEQSVRKLEARHG